MIPTARQLAPILDVREAAARLSRGELRLDEWDSRQVLALANLAVPKPRPIDPFPGWRFGFSADGADEIGRLRQEIWRYFSGPRRDGDMVMTWADNIRVRVHLGSDLGWALFVDGCFEPNQFAFLHSVLNRGMAFFDVGANDGLYSLFASKLCGPEGIVIALEPSRREFGRLQSNLRLNHTSNALPIRVAAWHRNGTATLQVAEEAHAGHNTLGRFVYQTEKVADERVRTVRLDVLIKRRQIHRVDVLKIDVEGAETAVLQGSVEMIQRDHPIVLVEASHPQLQSQGSSSGELLELVRAWGYRVYGFDGTSGLPTPAEHPPADDPNILAIHPRGPRVSV